MDKTRFIGCEVGIISEIYAYGIIPVLRENELWKENNIYAYCGPSDDEIIGLNLTGVNYCTDKYWKDKDMDQITTECLGSRSCDVNLRDYAPDIATE